MKFTKRLLALIFLVMLAGTACGGDDDLGGPDEYTLDAPEPIVEGTTELPDDTDSDDEEDHAEDAGDSGDEPDDVGIGSDTADSDDEPNDADTTTTTTAVAATPVAIEPADSAAAVEEPPIESQVASTPEFCEASAGYYASTEAGDFVPRSNRAAVRSLFEAMDRRLIAAADAAPNDELAEPVLAAMESLAAVHDGIASFDYDGDAFEGSTVMTALAAEFDLLAKINDLLEQYLVGECGLQLQQLRVEGSNLGTAMTERADASAPVEFVEVTDSAERIRLQVPTHWDDVVNQQTGETAVMIASPNAALFDSSWAIDGIRVMTAPTAAVTVDRDTAMSETAAAIECRSVSSDPYDDGTYVGRINRYRNCGGSTFAIVIGAASHDGEYSVLVEMQFDDHDTAFDATTLQMVTDTFIVR
jgi:hypothetical protein